MFNTPPPNQKLRINLPEWSKGLPLKAEAVDFNDPFYRNGDNLKDDMWPCRLKDSNIPKFSQSELSTHFIDESQPEKILSVKGNTNTQPTENELPKKSKLYRIPKMMNRKK